MAANPFDDLSAPSDIGAAPPPPSSRPPAAENKAANGVGRPTPESLHYHDDEQRCDMCDHFGRGNQCAVLRMPVEPGGGCNAFRGGAGAPDTDTADTAADTDTDEDDAGSSYD